MEFNLMIGSISNRKFKKFKIMKNFRYMKILLLSGIFYNLRNIDLMSC